MSFEKQTVNPELTAEQKELIAKLSRAWETEKPVTMEHHIPGHLVREVIQKESVQFLEESRIPLLVTKEIWIINKRDPKKRKNLCDKAPKNVNFININYLPRGYRETEETANEFGYYEVEKDDKIYKMILYAGANCVGDRLSILHEISHARKRNQSRAAREAGTRLKDDFVTAYEERRKGTTPGEVLFRPDKKMEPRPVDIGDAYDFLDLDSKSEREAWAFALQELRAAQHAGVDLEPSLKKNNRQKRYEQLRKIVHGLKGLGSYEEQALKMFPKNPEFFGFYSRYYQPRKNKKG